MGQITEDVYFSGVTRHANLIPNAGAISDAHIAAAANVATSKLRHRHAPVYSQPNTTATTETRVIGEGYGAAGTVVAFRAGSIAPCTGAGTITADLRKNGTTVLSAAITLNASSVAYVSQEATISTPTIAAGDVLTVVITATAGGGAVGTGFWCQAVIDEAGV